MALGVTSRTRPPTDGGESLGAAGVDVHFVPLGDQVFGSCPAEHRRNR